MTRGEGRRLEAERRRDGAGEQPGRLRVVLEAGRIEEAVARVARAEEARGPERALVGARRQELPGERRRGGIKDRAARGALIAIVGRLCMIG